MKRSRPFLAALLLALSASVVLAQAVDPARYVTTMVAIGGNVERKLTLTVDDLKRLPVQQIVERRNVSGTSGAATESTRRLTGVLLRDVLDAAGLIERQRSDLRHSYIVALASDGYSVVFSWGELYNAAVGDGALVVYEQEGAPLSDSEGKIALVSVNDKRPGPRHVKWLTRIDVRVAGE